MYFTYFTHFFTYIFCTKTRQEEIKLLFFLGTSRMHVVSMDISGNLKVQLLSSTDIYDQNRMRKTLTFGKDAKTCCFMSHINVSTGYWRHLNISSSGTCILTSIKPSLAISAGGKSSSN